MIAPGAGVRVYLACGRTDLRRGLDGLAMLVQQSFSENPFSGAVFAFRGRKWLGVHDATARSSRTARRSIATSGPRL